MVQFLTVFSVCFLQVISAKYWPHFASPKSLKNNTIREFRSSTSDMIFTAIKTGEVDDPKYHFFKWTLKPGQTFQAKLYIPGSAYKKMETQSPTVEISATPSDTSESFDWDTDRNIKETEVFPLLMTPMKQILCYKGTKAVNSTTVVTVRINIETADKYLRYAIAVGSERKASLGMAIENMLDMQRAKMWGLNFHAGGLGIAVSILYVVFQFWYSFMYDGAVYTKNIISLLQDIAALCFAVMIVDAFVSGIVLRSLLPELTPKFITLHILPNTIYLFLTIYARIVFNWGYYTASAFLMLCIFISCLMWGSGGLLLAPICLGFSVVVSRFFFWNGYVGRDNVYCDDNC